ALVTCSSPVSGVGGRAAYIHTLVPSDTGHTVSTETIEHHWVSKPHLKVCLGGKVYFFMTRFIKFVAILSLDTLEWHERVIGNPLFHCNQSHIRAVWALDGLIFIVVEHDKPREYPGKGIDYRWSTWVYNPEAQADTEQHHTPVDTQTYHRPNGDKVGSGPMGFAELPGVLREIRNVEWAKCDMPKCIVNTEMRWDSIIKTPIQPVVVGGRAYFHTTRGMLSFGRSLEPGQTDSGRFAPAYDYYLHPYVQDISTGFTFNVKSYTTLYAVGHHILILPCTTDAQTYGYKTYALRPEVYAYDTVSSEYILWTSGIDLIMYDMHEIAGPAILFEPETVLAAKVQNITGPGVIWLEVDQSLLLSHGGDRLGAQPREVAYLELGVEEAEAEGDEESSEESLFWTF
ncbi:hypothetical protein KIPB_010661, partial [Kipferlia bialata]